MRACNKYIALFLVCPPATILISSFFVSNVSASRVLVCSLLWPLFMGVSLMRINTYNSLELASILIGVFLLVVSFFRQKGKFFLMSIGISALNLKSLDAMILAMGI